MEINEIDKNFEIESNIDEPGIRWIPVTCENFEISGLFDKGREFKRLDSEVAEKTSEGVYNLHKMTSGGRLTFETDSHFVAVKLKARIFEIPLMNLIGTAGMDLYVEREDGYMFYAPFVPPADSKNGYKSIVRFHDKKMRKILIHLPIYNEINELYIGLYEGASLKKMNPYKNEKPMVFYGSSITHGGCTTRPGNTYPAIVSRKTMMDFNCLGFPGRAHGEQTMAEYIANLPMSVFIMDYDHNDCNNYKLLKERHYPFYKTVREKNPDLPIIIMSAPYTMYNEKNFINSRQVVLETYNKAKENGENVYFIDGMTVFGEFADCAVVDTAHPNDFGFVKMAEAVLNVFKEIGIYK